MNNLIINKQFKLVGIYIILVLLGFNLRPIMVSVSPLLAQIQLATGLNNSQAGMLTTLPVFAMGVFALLGGKIQYYVGEKKGISIGIVIIIIACAMRSFVFSANSLIISAAFAGIGIAIVQALVPAYIRAQPTAHTGSLMGIYTSGIMAGAAISAASVAPIYQLLPLQLTLAIWALPAIVALAVWLKVTKQSTESAITVTNSIPASIYNGKAWLLMIYFGIGTAAYTLVLAWMPIYYISLGWTASKSGFMLGFITLTEVMAGLIVAATINKFHDRRLPLAIVLTSLLFGFILLLTVPITMVFLVVILIGVGIGALFPLSLILTMDHAIDGKSASTLLGFVQGGGYIIASFMPLIAGVLREYFTDLNHAWHLMILGVIAMMLITMFFKPKSPSIAV